MKHCLYYMKTIIREKSFLFWSLAFPLILGVIFYFMFSGIKEMDAFSEIPVGLITGADEEFVNTTRDIALENGRKMFLVTEYADMESALSALENEEITGIIEFSDKPHLTVTESSTQTSMLRTYVDQYIQNAALIEDIIKDKPEAAATLIAGLSDSVYEEIGIRNIDLKGQDKDCYSQYFFALLAMTCLIASNVGVKIGNNIQGNLSTIGARRCIAPTTKFKQIITDFLGAFIIYDLLSLIVLFFCIFVLGRDFGTNLPLIILATFVGNFNGLSVGLLISLAFRSSAKSKDALCVAYFLVSSFFAGLQWADITYLLEKSCPIVNRINPATLIVNSYKSLAVFGDMRKYAINLLTLLGISILCLIVSVAKLRRTRYESI